jgi:hypothetical protein
VRGELVSELGEQRGAVAATALELGDQLIDLGVLILEKLEYVNGVSHAASALQPGCQR